MSCLFSPACLYVIHKVIKLGAFMTRFSQRRRDYCHVAERITCWRLCERVWGPSSRRDEWKSAVFPSTCDALQPVSRREVSERAGETKCVFYMLIGEKMTVLWSRSTDWAEGELVTCSLNPLLFLLMLTYVRVFIKVSQLTRLVAKCSFQPDEWNPFIIFDLYLYLIAI